MSECGDISPPDLFVYSAQLATNHRGSGGGVAGAAHIASATRARRPGYVARHANVDRIGHLLADAVRDVAHDLLRHQPASGVGHITHDFLRFHTADRHLIGALHRFWDHAADAHRYD